MIAVNLDTAFMHLPWDLLTIMGHAIRAWCELYHTRHTLRCVVM
jgi:hypothetical protein